MTPWLVQRHSAIHLIGRQCEVGMGEYSREEVKASLKRLWKTGVAKLLRGQARR